MPQSCEGAGVSRRSFLGGVIKVFELREGLLVENKIVLAAKFPATSILAINIKNKEWTQLKRCMTVIIDSLVSVKVITSRLLSNTEG